MLTGIRRHHLPFPSYSLPAVFTPMPRLILEDRYHLMLDPQQICKNVNDFTLLPNLVLENSFFLIENMSVLRRYGLLFYYDFIILTK